MSEKNSIEKWETLTNSPAIVEFFENLFENLGVRVTDTNEEFTCHHRGDKIELKKGLDEEAVDYTVEIESFQVDRLVAHTHDKEIDEIEKYRIVCVLFTPATAATLKKRLSGKLVRFLLGAEPVTHVNLKSSSHEEPNAQHTLVVAGNQWLAIPGLHGDPDRIYHMTVDEALLYHRRVFATMKKDTFGAWWKFGGWYKDYRETISTCPRK